MRAPAQPAAQHEGVRAIKTFVQLFRRRQLTAALIMAAILVACGGGSSGSAPAVTIPVSADLTVAKSVYDPDLRTPPGFYVEPQMYPDRQVFKFHVRNTDIDETAQIGAVSYELCSDDFVEALDWSAISSTGRDLESTLSGNGETEWYYQFDRDVQSAEPAMVVNRVFKCSGLDRAELNDSGQAGVVNLRPFGAQDLRWLAEYFWNFSFYNNALNSVLASTGSADDTHYRHTIERAEAITGGGQAGCDRIEVWHWDYSADKNSGEIDAYEVFVRAFDARQVSGVVGLCN